jgi:hypothetical protein
LVEQNSPAPTQQTARSVSQEPPQQSLSWLHTFPGFWQPWSQVPAVQVPLQQGMVPPHSLP